MTDTPLQCAIIQASREHLPKRMHALSKCNSNAEYAQCTDAYQAEWWNIVDVISQQHGMQPMLRRYENT